MTVRGRGLRGENMWDTGGGGRYAVTASASINFTGEFFDGEETSVIPLVRAAAEATENRDIYISHQQSCCPCPGPCPYGCREVI